MKSATNGSSPKVSNILKRRDKRRHFAASVDLKDLLAVGPDAIIALAVRFDESRGKESLLKVPLETGSLYDSQQFIAALQYLRDQTKPPTQLSPRRKSPKIYPDQQALTPIILCGLLTAMHEQQASPKKLEKPLLSTSELMTQCQSMRQAAVYRVRLRKQRHRAQRIVLPIVSGAILLYLYVRRMDELRCSLIDLGFHNSSCDEIPAYAPACRLTEAWLWSKYRMYALKSDVTRISFVESPFSMHTTLVRDVITLQELDSGHVSRSLTRPRTVLLPVGDRSDNARWLGETIVNREVREAVESHLKTTKATDLSVLDIGCGVGGTLHSLLPDRSESHMKFGFRYTGITASAAEVYLAKHLLSQHNLNLHQQFGIEFLQQSFDQVLPQRNFSVAIAIESLAYSRNLKKTIQNALAALKPSGLLVIVDDVVRRGAQLSDTDTYLRPSLGTHQAWLKVLKDENCELKTQKDLSQEYEVVLEHDMNILEHNPATVWGIIPFSVSAFWEQWMANIGNSAAQRFVDLQEEQFQLTELWNRRNEGYVGDANLSYHMYVCVKQ